MRVPPAEAVRRIEAGDAELDVQGDAEQESLDRFLAVRRSPLSMPKKKPKKKSKSSSSKSKKKSSKKKE